MVSFRKKASAAAEYPEIASNPEIERYIREQIRLREPKAFTQDRNDFVSFMHHDFQISMIKFAVALSIISFISAYILGIATYIYLWPKIMSAYTTSYTAWIVTGLIITILITSSLLIHKIKHFKRWRKLTTPKS